MKTQTFEHNGYVGSIEFDLEHKTLHGKLLFINDLVTYEAADLTALEREFIACVDEYLEFCKAEGVEPNKPMRGVFNVRVTPELHRAAAIASAQENVSLNDFVRKALEMRLENCREVRHTHIHRVANEGREERFTAKYVARASSEDIFGDDVGRASVRTTEH